MRSHVGSDLPNPNNEGAVCTATSVDSQNEASVVVGVPMLYYTLSNHFMFQNVSTILRTLGLNLVNLHLAELAVTSSNTFPALLLHKNRCGPETQ